MDINPLSLQHALTLTCNGIDAFIALPAECKCKVYLKGEGICFEEKHNMMKAIMCGHRMIDCSK